VSDLQDDYIFKLEGMVRELRQRIAELEAETQQLAEQYRKMKLSREDLHFKLAACEKERDQLAEEKQLHRGIEAFYAGAVIDAKRWRYWRSLYDIHSEQNDAAAQRIERAMTPEELDAAVDKEMLK
jgi:predicted nuclease with TOPRIM domain